MVKPLNLQEPPVNSGVSLPKHKLGHNFLFVLCDMKAAVIVFDLAMLVAFGVTLVMSLKFIIGHPYSGGHAASHLVLTFIALATHGLSLFGAIKYKVWPLLVNVAYLSLGHLWAILLGVNANNGLEEHTVQPFRLIVIPTLGLVLGLYPHLVLAYQIHCGIMTKERYNHYEKQCCCFQAKAEDSAV